MVDYETISDRCIVHLVFVFSPDVEDDHIHDSPRDHIENYLEENDIRYGGVLTLTTESGHKAAQVKMQRSSYELSGLNDIEEWVSNMDSHINTWVLSESILEHQGIIG